MIRDNINSFEEVESHYCRKKRNKEYLPSDLNIRKMYNLYEEMCSENGNVPVKESFYREIFVSDFNLSFNKPLKDQCDLCTEYNHSSSAEKHELENVYKKHITNKELAREQKESDKQKAKSGDDQSLCVSVFDLQEILLTPNAFASSMYYKRRLNSYNFTVYNMGTGNGYSYIWHESIASRGGNEIASCVFDYIKSMSQKGKKDFIFFSDNCTSQNKNRMYVTMLWYAIQKFKLNSVSHKYLEKGHTQNEGDSMHAAIECAAKDKKPIYSTAEWAPTIRMARPKRPYIVKEMSLTDFLDFKGLSLQIKNFETNTEGQKLYWNTIKTLKINGTNHNSMEYKIDYSGETLSLDFFQKLRLRERPSISDLQVRQLRSEYIKIPWDKYVDLLTLCRKNIIPSLHHTFYLMLPHQSKK